MIIEGTCRNIDGDDCHLNRVTVESTLYNGADSIGVVLVIFCGVAVEGGLGQFGQECRRLDSLDLLCPLQGCCYSLFVPTAVIGLTCQTYDEFVEVAETVIVDIEVATAWSQSSPLGAYSRPLR